MFLNGILYTMSQQHPKLILLPGLGTDERLFEPQRKAFPDLWVPPWILPKDNEGLADYAARMADIIVGGLSQFSRREKETVPLGPSVEPFVLGGMSMGGMIAYEIARHVKPRALILIASCHTLKGVNGFLRAAGHLWPVVPVGAFKVAKFVSLPVLRTFGALTPDQRKLCGKMFSEMDSRFMHWAIKAVLDWNPAPLEETPIFHIHGARDQIIPAKYVSADKIIPDGGHMINLSHADAVNAYIGNVIANIQSR
jgi:pimeloyl-ACP methyl ester carboxylesterase